MCITEAFMRKSGIHTQIYMYMANEHDVTKPKTENNVNL